MAVLLPENNIFSELESVLKDFCIDSRTTPEDDWQQVGGKLRVVHEGNA